MLRRELLRVTPAVEVRSAGVEDAAEVARIYNTGIASRQATFETEHRTSADMTARITGTGPRHAFLVALVDGRVAGWAATFPYSARAVYDGVAEYSVYVDPEVHGRGVGRALLSELLVRARAAGLHKVTSRVFPENTASLTLAESLGFRVVGTHHAHARLDGRWQDVLTVEALLLPEE